MHLTRRSSHSCSQVLGNLCRNACDQSQKSFFLCLANFLIVSTWYSTFISFLQFLYSCIRLTERIDKLKKIYICTVVIAHHGSLLERSFSIFCKFCLIVSTLYNVVVISTFTDFSLYKILFDSFFFSFRNKFLYSINRTCRINWKYENIRTIIITR